MGTSKGTKKKNATRKDAPKKAVLEKGASKKDAPKKAVLKKVEKKDLDRKAIVTQILKRHRVRRAHGTGIADWCLWEEIVEHMNPSGDGSAATGRILS